MIILLIVSVAGVLLLNLSLQTTSAQENSLQDQIDRETGAAVERFKIIGVQRIDDYLMEITIFNFAKENTLDIKVSEIYINNINVDSVAGTLEISAGKISSLTIQSPIILLNYSDPSKPNYIILVVSERGVGTTYVWSIPDKVE
jgi:hypothetical protein